MSDAFLSMVGYSRSDFVTGMIDWDAITPVVYWPLDEQCLAQLACSETADAYVKELICKDGSLVAVRVFSARTVARSGEEIFSIMIRLRELADPLIA